MTTYIVYKDTSEQVINKCDNCGKFTNYRTTRVITEVDNEGQFIDSHECETCREERRDTNENILWRFI